MLSGGFRFTQPTLPRAMTTTKKKGSGTPTDVFSQPPRPTFILPRLRGGHRRGARACTADKCTQVCAHKIRYTRSPIGVPPRFWLQRTNAAVQLQVRASWDVVGAHDPKAPNNRVRKNRALFSGRYPLLPVPVQRAPRRPVIMPAGRSFPKPPGSGVYRSARRHRTRSTFRSTLGRRRPSLSEIRPIL